MPAPLIEFPADDPERALRFWRRLLGVELAPSGANAGEGWEAEAEGLRLGVHERGTGPGDTGSLPYFTVDDMATALERVHELGGSVVHPGARWGRLPGLGGKPVRACHIAAGCGVIVAEGYRHTSRRERGAHRCGSEGILMRYRGIREKGSRRLGDVCPQARGAVDWRGHWDAGDADA